MIGVNNILIPRTKGLQGLRYVSRGVQFFQYDSPFFCSTIKETAP